MSYWAGYARGYSRAVERANEAVHAAEKALVETMLREYPIDSAVRVVHHRGSYTGTVVGVDKFGVRIDVRDDRTGKTRKWWAAHVERIGTGDAR